MMHPVVEHEKASKVVETLVNPPSMVNPQPVILSMVNPPPVIPPMVNPPPVNPKKEDPESLSNNKKPNRVGEVPINSFAKDMQIRNTGSLAPNQEVPSVYPKLPPSRNKLEENPLSTSDEEEQKQKESLRVAVDAPYAPIGSVHPLIKITIYKYKKWFPRLRECFVKGPSSLCRDLVDSDWQHAKVVIEDFFTAEQFDFGFGKGKTIRTGTPTGAGIQLKPEDKLSAFGNTFTMVLTDEYSWDAGPFLAATAGTFITTIIKSRHHTSNPEFGLSVAGLALWGIGFALQVAGIIDFRSLESSKREKIFAQLVSYLIAIIVIVSSGFVPSPTSSASN